MILRQFFIAAAASLATIMSAAPHALAQDKIDVVASFSILADMAKQVGGERVNVAALVGPNGDTHVYEPTAGDAKMLSKARLLIMNGLALEGWLPRLVKASGFSGVQLVASDGIVPLKWERAESAYSHEDGHEEHSEDHRHGHYDPHAWQSLANGIVYVRNIADALAKLDPDHAEGYKNRSAVYIVELKALDAKLKADFAALPAVRRKVVTSHDAFRYFGEAYGLSFTAPAGISTVAEPSAAGVAKIIDQIRDQKLAAVFIENISDDRLIRQIAHETNATIGGKLYSGALSDESGPVPSYVKMFKHNASQLLSALAGS